MWKNNTKGIMAPCLLLLSLPSRDLTSRGGTLEEKTKKNKSIITIKGYLKGMYLVSWQRD